jgi:hypothetical protein
LPGPVVPDASQLPEVTHHIVQGIIPLAKRHGGKDFGTLTHTGQVLVPKLPQNRITWQQAQESFAGGWFHPIRQQGGPRCCIPLIHRRNPSKGQHGKAVPFHGPRRKMIGLMIEFLNGSVLLTTGTSHQQG